MANNLIENISALGNADNLEFVSLANNKVNNEENNSENKKELRRVHARQRGEIRSRVGLASGQTNSAI